MKSEKGNAYRDSLGCIAVLVILFLFYFLISQFFNHPLLTVFILPFLTLVSFLMFKGRVTYFGWDTSDHLKAVFGISLLLVLIVYSNPSRTQVYFEKLFLGGKVHNHREGITLEDTDYETAKTTYDLDGNPIISYKKEIVDFSLLAIFIVFPALNYLFVWREGRR